jgi:ubiquinone/menaquinone biosynthesis C-methylase UbiE
MDFGYPWWLSYGHVPLVALAILLWLVGRARRWPVWPMVLIAIFGAWSISAFLVTRFVINANGRGSLPTEQFLASGSGRVLDIGAGTGRSSIMVLEARPQATLVALDLFGESYDQHFGKGLKPEDRLAANLRHAGFEKRAAIETADMRKLPFEDASFDAVVSAYAVDHLPRLGSRQALAEAARVLKPGGDFLLMLVHNEPWARFAFGPLVSHGAPRGEAWWSRQLSETGFRVDETGYRPLTLYFLARKPDAYARMSFTTCPATSVKRNQRPWN